MIYVSDFPINLFEENGNDMVLSNLSQESPKLSLISLLARAPLSSREADREASWRTPQRASGCRPASPRPTRTSSTRPRPPPQCTSPTCPCPRRPPRPPHGPPGPRRRPPQPSRRQRRYKWPPAVRPPSSSASGRLRPGTLARSLRSMPGTL